MLNLQVAELSAVRLLPYRLVCETPSTAFSVMACGDVAVTAHHSGRPRLESS
jgi:hypothetical protein